ncbi:hypothetical protein BLNAU_13559 [Blattamonas nauphoetae]|uniref:Uncharacterized protein n=1 Tax=Blattamonas nauphoetae TaxID=2049346 RepID=A0ABQ9XLN1_9EUKA|nr:hypothetical protein BLNAU_13559 [Blattamonas nauphoetae]
MTAFLKDLGQNSSNPAAVFVDSMNVLLSCSNYYIFKDALLFLHQCIDRCTSSNILDLVSAKLLPGILSTHRLRDLSGTANEDTLKRVLKIFDACLWPSSKINIDTLRDLVLHEVLIPIEPSLVQIGRNPHLLSQNDEYNSILMDGHPFDDSLEEKAAFFLDELWEPCSIVPEEYILGLVRPSLDNSLSPLSLSFAEAKEIHLHLLSVINHSIVHVILDVQMYLSTARNHAILDIEDALEQLPIHETVLKQVLVPSEQFIWHLFKNRFSIIDGDLSEEFLHFLAHFLEISPYDQPTRDFVLNMPVILSISSCLTLFEDGQYLIYPRKMERTCQTHSTVSDSTCWFVEDGRTSLLTWMRVDVMSPPHMCSFSIELLSQIVRPEFVIFPADNFCP